MLIKKIKESAVFLSKKIGWIILLYGFYILSMFMLKRVIAIDTGDNYIEKRAQKTERKLERITKKYSR